jgi:hypothetical protein
MSHTVQQHKGILKHGVSHVLQRQIRKTVTATKANMIYCPGANQRNWRPLPTAPGATVRKPGMMNAYSF